MEKGVKVVAVNDPFIDLEYMVSSRQKAGWGDSGTGVAKGFPGEAHGEGSSMPGGPSRRGGLLTPHPPQD